MELYEQNENLSTVVPNNVQQYVADHKEELRGPQGPKGDRGDTGATGPQGPSGSPWGGGTFTGNVFMNYVDLNPAVDGTCTIGNTGHRWNSAQIQNVKTDTIRILGYGNNKNVTVCSEALQSRNTANSAWTPVFASAFTTQSSKRYKDNIQPVTDERALQLLKVDVKTYDYIDGIVEPDVQYDLTGVIAEDVVKIIPEAVTYREIDGQQVPDGVDYAKFVQYLIRMMQIQQEEIAFLKSTLSKL